VNDIVDSIINEQCSPIDPGNNTLREQRNNICALWYRTCS